MADLQTESCRDDEECQKELGDDCSNISAKPRLFARYLAFSWITICLTIAPPRRNRNQKWPKQHSRLHHMQFFFIVMLMHNFHSHYPQTFPQRPDLVSNPSFGISETPWSACTRTRAAPPKLDRAQSHRPRPCLD